MNFTPNTARGAWPLVLLCSAAFFGLAALTMSGGGEWFDLSSRLGGAVYGLVFLPLVLGGGAAFGPLLFGTRVPESSVLKLALFSALLSPPLVALLWSVFAFWMELAPKDAWASTFGALGGLALLGVRGQVGRAPLGRAAKLSCVLALGLGGVVLWVTLTGAGLGLRLTVPSSIVSGALGLQIQDGAPLVNPWFSGGALELRPGIASLLAAVGGPQRVSPLFVSGVLSGWCAALVVLAGYLCSAAAFREGTPELAGRRDVVGAWAGGAAALGWAVSGARVDLWLSLAYGFGFMLAALHVVRRGARPWPGLAACHLAVLGMIHPWAAAACAGVFGISALTAGRAMAVPLGAMALLPGLVQGRLFGGFGLDQTTTGVAGEWVDQVGQRHQLPAGLGKLMGLPEQLMLGVGAFGALALAIHLARGRRVEDGAVARRGVLFVGLLGIVLGSCPLWSVGLPAIELVPLSMLGCALLGAMCGGLAGTVGRGAFGVLLAAGLGALAAAGPVLKLRALLEPEGAPPVFEESVRGIGLSGPGGLKNGLDEAFRFLAASEHASNPRAVLFREPGLALGSDVLEPLSLGPILSGIPLFGALGVPPGTRQSRVGAAPLGDGRSTLGDHWTDRQELLDVLFEQENKWQPRYDRVLRAAVAKGLTLVFVVTEADRRATTDRGVGPRGVDMPLVRLGAEEISFGEETSVYVLAPPEIQVQAR